MDECKHSKVEESYGLTFCVFWGVVAENILFQNDKGKLNYEIVKFNKKSKNVIR